MLTALRFTEWIGLVSSTYTILVASNLLNNLKLFLCSLSVMLPLESRLFVDNFTSCMSSSTCSDAILSF